MQHLFKVLGTYKNRWVFVAKETSRTKSPPSDAWEGTCIQGGKLHPGRETASREGNCIQGGREGNCILIPATLKLDVTMASSKNSNTWDFLLQLFKVGAHQNQQSTYNETLCLNAL